MGKKLNVFLMAMSIAMLVGCGGGGGGGGTTTIEETPITHALSGVAAAGAPVSGIVHVKGADGKTASITINANGVYSINVTGITPPYIVYAEGTVDGTAIKIFSAGVAEGVINITPITDLILRNALGESAETAYDTWGTDSISGTKLAAAETVVQNQLKPVLDAAGVAADADLIATPFNADHTGLDAVLDVLNISYSGNTATVKNNYTGSSYSDDITNVNDGAGFPASDKTATQQVLTDAQTIDAFWKSLETLYASSPSDAAIISWCTNHIADDYLNGGMNEQQSTNDWKNNGMGVGFTSSIEILRACDVSSTSYTKGYYIGVWYKNTASSTPQYGETNMVYDGTKWLMWGNRQAKDSQTYHITYTAGCQGYVLIARSYNKLWYEGFDLTGNNLFGTHMIIPFATHSSPLAYMQPQVGQTWTSTGFENEIPVQSSTIVVSISESVDVPAGSFNNCVKTVETLTIQTSYPNFPNKCERWFAPGIGPIKLVSTYPDGSTQSEVLTEANTPGASADDYFPLSIGYSWSSKSSDQTSSWTVDEIVE